MAEMTYKVTKDRALKETIKHLLSLSGPPLDALIRQVRNSIYNLDRASKELRPAMAAKMPCPFKNEQDKV